jgi:hypothetical protein
MSKDNKIIERIMRKEKLCSFKDKESSNFTNLTTTRVKKILTEDYYSGPNMKAVMCMFDSLIHEVKRKSKLVDSVQQIDVSINEHISGMKLLKFSTESGFVYFTNFFDTIETVVKIPQRTDDVNDFIREYFVGAWYMNKLRYKIPNFMYTFGAFMCNQVEIKKSTAPSTLSNICTTDVKLVPYIITEKVPGNTLTNIGYYEESFTFDKFLVVFVQVLIALEVAQRECRFTHYDLHIDNVMLRTSNIHNYSVNIGPYRYNIEPEYLPVIIDYGFTSVYVNDDGMVGLSDSFSEYNIYKFMIQGYDVYRFLYSSAETFTHISDDIMNLFRVYQNNSDPYKVFWNRKRAVKRAAKDVGKKTVNSPVATYTPAMVLDWLLRDDEYSTIIKRRINITPRNTLENLYYQNTMYNYYDIFSGYTGEQLNELKQTIQDCMRRKPSYIFSMYNIHTLSLLDKNVNNILSDDIAKLKNYTEVNKNSLIKLDKVRMEKFFSITLPERRKLDFAVKNIISLSCLPSLLKAQRSRIRECTSTSKLKVFDFYHKIQGYLELIYMCKECKLTEFDDIIRRIESSTTNRFYQEKLLEIEQALRWKDTLLTVLRHYK